MRKIFITLVFVFLLVVFLFLPKKLTSPANKTTTKSTIASVPSTITTTTVTKNVSQVYYPISRYNERIKIKWYGKKVLSSDPIPTCGRSFSGYHVGDDLEIFPGEKNREINVYAITSGVVKQTGNVGGYGGLVVIESMIAGQKYTIYYGHIKDTLGLAVGQSVKVGQKLAILGTGCSTETDGERKHLHFAIHTGPAIDVRGYVPSTNYLKNWIDPKQFLASQNANAVN